MGLERRHLPYGLHTITQADIDAVVAVLKSDLLTTGPVVSEFEATLARMVGAPYAVVVSSGTAALHLAVMAQSFRSGSSGITSALTFSASANCMVYCGMNVEFCDIEPSTGLMSMTDLETGLRRKKLAGDPIQLVVPVHYSGQPVDMETLWRLKRDYGFKIVEDGCHALGAKYANGANVGNASQSECVIFSFHPVKHVAAGEGGAILTHDRALYDRLIKLRSHGMTRSPEEFVNKTEAFSSEGLANSWYYEMQELGFNYRMPDINAALGLSQLKGLSKNVEKRRRLARLYAELMPTQLDVSLLDPDRYGTSSFHLQVVRLNDARLCERRDAFIRRLIERRIGTQVHYIPVPMLPYYKSKGFDVPPRTLKLYRQCLSVPLFPAMDEEDVRYVCHTMGQTAREVILQDASP